MAAGLERSDGLRLEKRKPQPRPIAAIRVLRRSPGAGNGRGWVSPSLAAVLGAAVVLLLFGLRH